MNNFLSKNDSNDFSGNEILSGYTEANYKKLDKCPCQKKNRKTSFY